MFTIVNCVHNWRFFYVSYSIYMLWNIGNKLNINISCIFFFFCSNEYWVCVYFCSDSDSDDPVGGSWDRKMFYWL
jgi:hypothetical protein